MVTKLSKKGKILVFCRYGKGRPASVAIAYLCGIGYGHDEAVKFVAKKRAGINPLPGLCQIISMALKTESLYKGEEFRLLYPPDPLGNITRQLPWTGAS